MSTRLETYRRERNVDLTNEPQGSTGVPSSDGPPRFVIQHHAASSEHYDFRLEYDGVLLSWAVPRGPSTDPRDRRLAVHTEDHPIEYLDFEGTIPIDQYGGGAVIVWDIGTWEHSPWSTTDDRSEDEGQITVAAALDRGHLNFRLDGQKLQGGYTLQRFRSEEDHWLLIKRDDESSDARRNPTSTQPKSVLSGYTVAEVQALVEPSVEVRNDGGGDTGGGDDGQAPEDDST